MSVPGVDAWYARNLYLEGSTAYEHHVKTYGHPSKFGYKDIIPLWKAEKFDPDALVADFKKAGARYIVPVAVHHDNFDCWNSKHTRWNAVNMGPKRDIVGMWRRAALRHDLRFGVSEHLERSYSWLNTCKGSDKKGPLAGVPYDGNDPKYSDLYFEPHDDTSPTYPKNAPESWKQAWLERVTDLVDHYRPDLLYTDGGLPFGEYGLKMVSHFYNRNTTWNGGKLEAVYTIKNFAPRTDHGEFREHMCVEDLERGVLDQVKLLPWQTDTCIGNWFYHTDRKYKTAELSFRPWWI
jgi:alpha-L-fucosidase